MSKFNPTKFVKRNILSIIFLIVLIGQNFGSWPLAKDLLWPESTKVAEVSVTPIATHVTPAMPTDRPITVTPVVTFTPTATDAPAVTSTTTSLVTLEVGKPGCVINPPKKTAFTYVDDILYTNQCKAYVILGTGKQFTVLHGTYVGKISINGSTTTHWWKYETVKLNSTGFPAVKADSYAYFPCTYLKHEGEYYYPYCK